jgi:VIT1/CCC1 family predicted Fe2+/Mn2+ transporter
MASEKDRKMRFPLSTSDIGLWLAVTAIILLITSEVLFYSTGKLGNVAIEKKRLRLVALALGIGFMATVIMRIFRPT